MKVVEMNFSKGFVKFLDAAGELLTCSMEGELDNVACVERLNDIRACLVDMEATKKEIEMGLNIMKACVDAKDEDMAINIIMTWMKPFIKENIEIGLKNYISDYMTDKEP